MRRRRRAPRTRRGPTGSLMPSRPHARLSRSRQYASSVPSFMPTVPPTSLMPTLSSPTSRRPTSLSWSRFARVVSSPISLSVATGRCKIIQDRPTDRPTNQPTDRPTNRPINQPTDRPTNQPTNQPTDQPTDRPTNRPTNQPTDQPTDQPTFPFSSTTMQAVAKYARGRGDQLDSDKDNVDVLRPFKDTVAMYTCAVKGHEHQAAVLEGRIVDLHMNGDVNVNSDSVSGEAPPPPRTTPNQTFKFTSLSIRTLTHAALTPTAHHPPPAAHRPPPTTTRGGPSCSSGHKSGTGSASRRRRRCGSVVR